MTGYRAPKWSCSVWLAPGLLALLFLFQVISAGSTRAQSSEEYSRWVEWCISIGGTPSGTSSNPVCIPGTAPPCCDPPPDPNAYLIPYYNRFNAILDELRPYSETAAGFGSQGLADEATLSSVMKALYDPLFVEYLRVDDTAYLYRQQFNYFNEQTEALRSEVNALETRAAENREKLSALAAQAESLKATLAAEQAIGHPLRDLGLALYSDQRSDAQLASLILTYAPSPPLTVAALDERPAAESIGGWRDDGAVGGFTAHYAPVYPPPPWPQQPIGGRTIYTLEPSAPLDAKFETLEVLKGQRIQATLDYNANGAEADRLRAGFEPMWNRKVELNNQSSDDGIDISNAEGDVVILNLNIEAATANKVLAARFFSGEMVLALAKDLAVDKMKGAVSELLEANGLPSELPAMSSDDLVAAAKSGIRVAIPEFGFQEQWNTFIDIQKQSLDLLGRAEGYMNEAARLCASASPEQLERLSERVFADVHWQAADLVRQVGFSSLQPEDKSIFEGLIDKYVAARKPQDAQ